MFDYQVIRSARRKSIALQIKSGQVLIRAPYGVTTQHIAQLVDSKTPWILAKLHLSSLIKAQDSANIVSLKHGGVLWLNGSKKTIQIKFSRKDPIVVDDHKVVIALNPRYQLLSAAQQNKQIKIKLESWFKQQMQSIISNKLPIFIAQTQLSPQSVNIRQYKARWGSCDNRGRLSFNYLLAMVPEWVVDYVIVHELCHLTHLNHSNAFWQLVGDFYPNYQEAKQWLKQHQHYLAWSCQQ